MDDIDRNIVLDAQDDYTLVGHTVIEIARIKGIEPQEAWKIFQTRFNKLSDELPISLYEAQELYGTMTATSFEMLSFEDILDSGRSISGPPFVYFSRTASGSQDDFDTFFNQNGFPKWLA